MLTTLNIVLGLIFVILMFSLLASTVMEVISAALSLRPKHLETFLRSMLVEHFDDFTRHPLFKQLATATKSKNRISSYQMPAWINKDTFTAIVGDMLDVADPAQLKARIESLDEGDVKRLLQFIMRRSGGNPQQFVKEMEFWFDEMMDRASAWYKRKMKWWLFSVGLVMALAFNVDTIQIYQSISQDTNLQEYLANAATEFASNTDTITGPNLNLSMDEAMDRYEEARARVEEISSSPLGLGWSDEETGGSIPDWLVKIAGLLLTGIAVTFGAPFWFDLLKKILSIRDTVGGSQPPPQASATPPPPPPADNSGLPPTSLTRPRSLEEVKVEVKDTSPPDPKPDTPVG
jgi:hypothetical protein